MQEEIKCPQCGGNKFSDRGNNTYKCMYCGSTFSVKSQMNRNIPIIRNQSQQHQRSQLMLMSVLIRNNQLNKDIIPNMYLQKVKRQLQY